MFRFPMAKPPGLFSTSSTRHFKKLWMEVILQHEWIHLVDGLSHGYPYKQIPWFTVFHAYHGYQLLQHSFHRESHVTGISRPAGALWFWVLLRWDLPTPQRWGDWDLDGFTTCEWICFNGVDHISRLSWTIIWSYMIIWYYMINWNIGDKWIGSSDTPIPNSYIPNTPILRSQISVYLPYQSVVSWGVSWW